MSIHDTIMETMLDIEKYLERPSYSITPDLEAILVRLEIFNFFHWTSPGGDGEKFWDKSQKLIAAPLTVEQLKSEFVKLVKEERGNERYMHDIVWNKWRIVDAIQHPSQLPGWHEAYLKMKG